MLVLSVCKGIQYIYLQNSRMVLSPSRINIVTSPLSSPQKVEIRQNMAVNGVTSPQRPFQHIFGGAAVIGLLIFCYKFIHITFCNIFCYNIMFITWRAILFDICIELCCSENL